MKEQKEKPVEVKQEKPEKTLDEIREEKLKELIKKRLSAEKLSDEENKILQDYENAINSAKMEAFREEKIKEYYAAQSEIAKEASEVNPDEVLSNEVKGIKLNAGNNPINEWITNFKVGRVIAKGKKKGGTFILKGFRDTGLELVWSKKPVRFVKFKIQNEKGELLEYVTRVVKTKHRWKGTSIPVHVALEGVNENIDLFEGAEVELSAEYVNKALTLQWNAGLLTGLAMRDEEAKDFMKAFAPLLLIIILLITCIMAYMMYSMYQKIDALDIGSLKALVQYAQQQLAVNVKVG